MRRTAENGLEVDTLKALASIPGQALGRAAFGPGCEAGTVGAPSDRDDGARRPADPAARYPRRGGARKPVPMGLVDDSPAAELGLLMRVTARPGKRHRRHRSTLHPDPEHAQGRASALGSIREAHTAGRDHRLGLPRILRRGRSRQGLLSPASPSERRRGQAPEDPLSRPHAGERQAHAEGAACKRSRTHRARPEIACYRRWRRRQRTFLGALRPKPR